MFFRKRKLNLNFTQIVGFLDFFQNQIYHESTLNISKLIPKVKLIYKYNIWKLPHLLDSSLVYYYIQK